MICPPTRAAALAHLTEFLPAVTRYARDRNFVIPGHRAVSRLSPAIRHRLVTEDEVAAAVLAQFPLTRVEKFIQEIYWRRYWKAWLSLRPQVWTEFRENLAQLAQHPSFEVGNSGNCIIDYFSRELVETGYLHNHARMWFAAWWIHEAHLPWELGAAFFHRHLLDGDPASNTLSWRWVAGLHTRGKTYLARRSNLETYLAPNLLEELVAGLPAFENPKPLTLSSTSSAAITAPDLVDFPMQNLGKSGLWIHEEDLSPENSPLGALKFHKILVTGHRAAWDQEDFLETKRDWLRSALADAAQRASKTWNCEAHVDFPTDLAASLIGWARANDLSQIVTLRPEIGLLHDEMASLVSEFAAVGIHLALVERPRDLEMRSLATGGFFQFWEKMQKQGLIAKPE
jgi:deoxyribodipyrimidine photo-lyase